MVALYRITSLGLLLLGVGALAVAVVITPPMMRRYILVDPQLQSSTTIVQMYAAASAALLATIALGWAARSLWRRARRGSARRFAFASVSIVFSLVVTLATAEVAARVLVDAKSLLTGDDYWVQRWHDEHHSPSAGDTLMGTYTIDQYDSELGWVPKPGYRSPELNINSRGLRGLRERPPTKALGHRRIVAVGDSFTFGEDVADHDVYTEVLESLLDDVSVINLGVHGYGTDQQYLRLKREGFAWAPDLVILGFYLRDDARNLLSFRGYAKPVFRIKHGQLILHNVPIPPQEQIPSVYSEVRSPRCYLWALANKAWTLVVERTVFSEKWTVTGGILDAIAESTREQGARLLLVSIPEAASEYRPETEVFLQQWATNRGVVFLNLREVFLELGDKQRGQLYDGHWTPTGHAVAAAAIYDTIIRERLLPER